MGILGSAPSGGVGGGKESGTSSTVSPYAALAAHIGKQIEAEVDPLRQQFLQMLLQVVTGGAAGLPVTSAATAAAKQGASEADQQTSDQLARMTGGTANPAAAAIEGSQRSQEGFNISQIPASIWENLIGQVNPAISSAQSGVSSMIGQAIAGNRTTTSSGSNLGWNLGLQPNGLFGSNAPPSGGIGGGNWNAIAQGLATGATSGNPN